MPSDCHQALVLPETSKLQSVIPKTRYVKNTKINMAPMLLCRLGIEPSAFLCLMCASNEGLTLRFLYILWLIVDVSHVKSIVLSVVFCLNHEADCVYLME